MTDDSDRIGERIRAASEGVSAPMALREHVDRAQSAPRRRPQHNRRQLLTVGSVLAAVAVMAGFLAPASATVENVAKAALHASERPAPADLDDYLPGYEAVGARSDKVGGRDAETVIYRRGGAGIHYTVVDGDPLDLPAYKHARAGALRLSLYRQGDIALVSWHARGKTCILASKAVSPDAMAALLAR